MFFVRVKDSAVVLTSTDSSTVAFPALTTQSMSAIYLTSAQYLLEGALLNLAFSITMSRATITLASVVELHLPVYHQPGAALTKNIFCRIN